MSTTEHRPSSEPTPAPTAPRPSEPGPADPRPAELPFTDAPTDRLPVVPPRAVRCSAPRPHRAVAGELAALAFTDLTALIPAQREPAPIEYRAAS